MLLITESIKKYLKVVSISELLEHKKANTIYDNSVHVYIIKSPTGSCDMK
uniref:Uncharacterized protein n=1 Tax=Arundo donax TaxID=35708 RepID=A0A0A9BPP0_ARUDO